MGAGVEGRIGAGVEGRAMGEGWGIAGTANVDIVVGVVFLGEAVGRESKKRNL